MNYREAWANGEIEAGTLVDAIEDQAREIERLTLAASVSAADANDAERELAALKAQPSGVVLPDGWIRLTIEHEPGYPEDVAFGPQRIMDRLKKWLDRYFEMRLNSPPVRAGGVDERAAFELQAAMRGLDISMFTPPTEKEYRNPDTQSEWKGWQARAQLPSQGGEAVEVVAYLNTARGNVAVYGPTVMDWDDEQEPVESLMTVAQHQRILAASVASNGDQKPIAKLHFRDLFPTSHWSAPEHAFLWQITPDEIRALPKRDIQLYTHPADQVAQPDAELVRQCIAQELATWEGDFKGPVHTAMRCLQLRIDAKLASLK